MGVRGAPVIQRSAKYAAFFYCGWPAGFHVPRQERALDGVAVRDGVESRLMIHARKDDAFALTHEQPRKPPLSSSSL